MDLLIPPPSPPSYLLSSNMMVAAEEQTSRSGSGSSGGGGGIWTQQENKMFENALAHFDIKTPDRFERVAAVLPGKTLRDVMSHYRDLEDDVNHIEAGLIPCPGYTSSSSSSFTLDWLKHHNPFCAGGKRRLLDQERKKGVPWTEEEHRLFLMGLKKYGKGDWRSISRNFVVTRTPTQVASHAQKYFIRLNSGGKDKRRASIHDITTLNLPENPPSPPSGLTMPSDLVESDHRNEAASRISMLKHGDRFAQLPYGIDPYAIKSEAQNPHRAMLI